MDLGLRDKVVIVTGGGIGIGAAISHACANEGAIPVIVNHDGDAIQANLEIMRSRGQRFGFIPLWLDSPAACQQAVERTLTDFGRIDALRQQYRRQRQCRPRARYTGAVHDLASRTISGTTTRWPTSACQHSSSLAAPS